MSVTVYKNAQFPNEKTTTNFVVEGTKFVQVGGDTSTFEKSADVKVVDLKGKLTIPPFADAHIHLDYVYTANLPTHETHRVPYLRQLIIGQSLKVSSLLMLSNLVPILPLSSR